MVSFRLDLNLQEIAGGDDLRDAVFDLIRWAESAGRVEELVNSARQENPGNPELRAFAEALGRHPASPLRGNDAEVPGRPEQRTTVVTRERPAGVAWRPIVTVLVVAAVGVVALYLTQMRARQTAHDAVAKRTDTGPPVWPRSVAEPRPRSSGPAATRANGDASLSNRAPSPSIKFTPSSGAVPLEVSLDASGSHDPDGDALSFDWELSGQAVGSGSVLPYTFTRARTYLVTLKVTDSRGGGAKKTLQLRVDPRHFTDGEAYDPALKRLVPVEPHGCKGLHCCRDQGLLVGLYTSKKDVLSCAAGYVEYEDADISVKELQWESPGGERRYLWCGDEFAAVGFDPQQKRLACVKVSGLHDTVEYVDFQEGWIGCDARSSVLTGINLEMERAVCANARSLP